MNDQRNYWQSLKHTQFMFLLYLVNLCTIYVHLLIVHVFDYWPKYVHYYYTCQVKNSKWKVQKWECVYSWWETNTWRCYICGAWFILLWWSPSGFLIFSPLTCLVLCYIIDITATFIAIDDCKMHALYLEDGRSHVVRRM